MPLKETMILLNNRCDWISPLEAAWIGVITSVTIIIFAASSVVPAVAFFFLAVGTIRALS